MIDVYYGKPPKLLSLPNCIEMSHATFRLYDCLWGLSDRYSGFQVEVTDDEIIKRTTLSKGALNLARKDLSRRGLILCNRQGTPLSRLESGNPPTVFRESETADPLHEEVFVSDGPTRVT
jgi:hypothetical protein